jgi:TonB family protein
VVEKDGSLSDIKIIRDPGSGLGDEAKRVLSICPNWQSGTQNGKNVRVQYTVPINFSLAGVPSPPIVKTYSYPPIDTTQGKVFSAVEVNPRFPGGEAAFGNFLKSKIRYPSLAKENNVQGRVFIQFVVEKDGALSNLRVLRDLGDGLGAEAMRVLSLCPNWEPGTQNGVPVRVLYTVPVNFTLSEGPSPTTDLYNSIPDSIKRNFRELYIHIGSHTNYSVSLVNNNIKGTIVANLSIDADQHIGSYKLTKTLDPELDVQIEQALKTFVRTINVKPGDYSLVITFSIGTALPELGDVKNYTKNTTVAGLIMIRNRAQ